MNHEEEWKWIMRYVQFVFAAAITIVATVVGLGIWKLIELIF